MRPVLLKWPSRGRPRLVAERLPLWNARPADVRFLFSLDSDDPSLPAYHDILHGIPNVEVVEGTSTGKVHAINRDMPADGWETCIVASDDMLPQREDYASLLHNALWSAFTDGDGVVQIPDGRRTDNLNTIPIFGAAYYQRFGYIYRPEYRSTHCDDEFTEVSHRLGKVTRLEMNVIRHDWIGDTDPHDPIHKRNESFFMRDAKLFESRRKFGFPG